MKKPIVSIIAALDNKNGIGKAGTQPFYIKEDLIRFKKLTIGHPVIMGRKTFEAVLSYLKKPFPKRTNIIITRDKKYHYKNCIICNSLKDAIDKAKEIDRQEVFIIGGGQIFNQAIKYSNRLYLTLIDYEFDCDVFFPDYKNYTKIIRREDKRINNIKISWIVLEKNFKGNHF